MKNGTGNNNTENYFDEVREMTLWIDKEISKPRSAEKLLVDTLVMATNRELAEQWNEMFHMPTLKVMWSKDGSKLCIEAPPGSAQDIPAEFDWPDERPGPLELGDWRRRAALIHLMRSKFHAPQHGKPYWVSGGNLILPLFRGASRWAFYRLNLPDADGGWTKANFHWEGELRYE